MSTPIQIRNLVKTFGHARALDGLNLEVAAGEVHGFLGPNGAGKSTTLRILLGLLRSTSGDITLLGGDPWHQASELHARLAYVPGDVALWPSLSGGEVLDLLARMRGGPPSQRRDELVERFQLDTKKKSRAYSKGNRQKVALISALEADVELLLLDEPTSGLDPIMEAEFRRYLANDRPAGQTVLLSSHILSEVEAACDRVTIINDGRTVESGSLAQMRHLSQTAVRAELDDPTLSVASLQGIHSAKIEGNVFTCTVESGHFDELLSTLATHGVRNLVCSPPSLEELFLSHYQQLPANTK